MEIGMKAALETPFRFVVKVDRITNLIQMILRTFRFSR